MKRLCVLLLVAICLLTVGCFDKKDLGVTKESYKDMYNSYVSAYASANNREIDFNEFQIESIVEWEDNRGAFILNNGLQIVYILAKDSDKIVQLTNSSIWGGESLSFNLLERKSLNPNISRPFIAKAMVAAFVGDKNADEALKALTEICEKDNKNYGNYKMGDKWLSAINDVEIAYGFMIMSEEAHKRYHKK